MTWSALRRYTVVIADDVADLRFLLSRALTATGRFEVVGMAANGREAVDEATRQRPDLTLLDLGMPEMNGLEALPRIRRAVPDCIVVVLSGFDPADMADAARERGAAGYLVKGLSPSQLAKELLILLDSIDLTQIPTPALEPSAEAAAADLERAEITLPADVTSGRQARAFVASHLVEWELQPIMDTALLLTSELVTNAVLHANSPVSVTVRRGQDRVRVEVADIGRGALRLEDPGLEATRGRGLLLIEALAAAWGTSSYEAGKLVWFELPATEDEEEAV